MINSGDVSLNGYRSEFIEFFSNQKKPVIWASGNHDRYHSDTVKIMGRPNDFYQKVGDIGFYVTYFENKTYNLLHKMLAEHIEDTDVTHQFFVVHFPIYTRGITNSSEFGKYVKVVEEFLDNNPKHRIRAFITGHDHLFSLFNRSNVFFLVNAPSGGKDETSFDKFRPGDLLHFNGTLEGPL